MPDWILQILRIHPMWCFHNNAAQYTPEYSGVWKSALSFFLFELLEYYAPPKEAVDLHKFSMPVAMHIFYECILHYIFSTISRNFSFVSSSQNKLNICRSWISSLIQSPSPPSSIPFPISFRFKRRARRSQSSDPIPMLWFRKGGIMHISPGTSTTDSPAAVTSRFPFFEEWSPFPDGSDS